jgi:hypothetical protein
VIGALRRRASRRDFDPWVLAIGIFAIALEMLVSARYGYHRDELYFLAAGQHPALGYVDQPLVAPFVARLEAVLFANSLVGLRVIPAVLLGWQVFVASSSARLMGGGSASRRLAALATALCGEYVATAHLLTTTVFDFAAWAGLLWCCCKLLSGANQRWWLAAGLFVGIGLDAKWNIAFLAVGVAIGFLAIPSTRALIATRWALIAVAIAVSLGWPDFVWQAMHGWPNAAVFRALQQDAGHNRAVYWPAQVIYTGLAATALWVAGVAALWRRKHPDRRWRSLAVAGVFVLALQFVLGGKPYYAGGIFVVLFAAGGVALERRWHQRQAAGARTLVRPGVTAIAIGITGALLLPVAIPVLPAQSLHAVPLQKINYDLAETIQWPREVSDIVAVFHGLPTQEQRHAIVLTGNYGEAGAVIRYGPQFGLPPGLVFSGANSFWLWGPPPRDATTVVAVNMDPQLLHRLFTSVRVVTVYTNGLGVANDEQGIEIAVATGLRRSWSQVWSQVQDYS